MPDGFPDPSKLPEGTKRQFLQGLLANPNLLPESFLGYLVDYLAINQPSIPITLVEGYSQTVPTSNTVNTNETTTSTSYTDLATTGPQVTALEPGQYLLYFGASAGTDTASATTTYRMSPSINAATPSDSDAVLWIGSPANGRIPGARAISTTLTASSNTVKMQYKTSAGGPVYAFQNRWLVVLRVGNK